MRTLPTSLLVLAAVVPCAFAACGGGQSTTTQPTATTTTPPTATAPPTATTDPVDAALFHEGQRVAADMQPDGMPIKLSLAAGGHQAQNVSLAAGKCYTIVAVPPQGGEVALTLKVGGQPVAGPAPALGAPPVPLCPPQALTVELDVMLKTGTGMVGVQMLSKFAPVAFAPPSTPSASASAGGADPAVALLKTNAAKLAKGMDVDGAPSKQTLKEGEKMSANATLVAGKCYAIIAVSPTGGVADIDMVLLPPPFYIMEAGKDARTDNVALIGGDTGLCPMVNLPMAYRIDATAKKGTGAVTLQVYSKNK